MFPDPDNTILLKAVLSQLDGRLNWPKLAEDIGADNLKAAQNRWGHYKRKLFSVGPSSPAITKTKSPAKSIIPRKNRNASARKPSTLKKRKLSLMRDDYDDDDDGGGIDLSIKDEEDVSQGRILATPTRKLPGRRARVTTFREESDSGKDMDDAEKRFEDSGDGGTETGSAAEGEISDDQS